MNGVVALANHCYGAACNSNQSVSSISKFDCAPKTLVFALVQNSYATLVMHNSKKLEVSNDIQFFTISLYTSGSHLSSPCFLRFSVSARNKQDAFNMFHVQDLAPWFQDILSCCKRTRSAIFGVNTQHPCAKLNGAPGDQSWEQLAWYSSAERPKCVKRHRTRRYGQHFSRVHCSDAQFHKCRRWSSAREI